MCEKSSVFLAIIKDTETRKFEDQKSNNFCFLDFVKAFTKML